MCAEGTESTADVPQWSVVVITRNEESRIGRCLESVFHALCGRHAEIILVDSASEDRTVDIAARFPVRTVRLSRNAFLSPAAGRHVGYRLARAKWILFMDGDSILDPAWIPAAEEAFNNTRLGGLAGIREAVFEPRDGGRPEVSEQYADLPGAYDDPAYLGGPAAYPRSVLEKVGGFNPFLYAEEEAELGGRLRAAGYSLKRLRVPMTRHLLETRRESLADLLRKVRQGFPLGIGQVVRYGIKHRCLSRSHLANLDRYAVFWALLVLGAVGLWTWWRWGNNTVLLSWATVCTVGFLIFCVRSRSIRKPLYYIVEWLVCGVMAVGGFLLRFRCASEYSLP